MSDLKNMKSNKPRVSVVLTSFNHAEFLRDAIESVLVQTYTNFELIIWDDASTDNSWEIIKSFKDSRIKAFRNEIQMRGIYGINKSISEISLGEYIAIHHSDDVWIATKLEEQVLYLDENANIGATFTTAQAIDEDGGVIKNQGEFGTSIFNQVNKTRFQWLRFFFDRGNALCHPSVLIRRECYEKCGLYRYGLAQLGDFDMWIRLLLKYDINIIQKDLVKFRIRSDNLNTSAPSAVALTRLTNENFFVFAFLYKLNSVSDYLEIFPELNSDELQTLQTVRHALAKFVLDTTNSKYIRLLALNFILEDQNFIPHSKSLEFIKTTGGENIFYDLKVLSLLDAQIKNYQFEITDLKSSLSWRITRPMRIIGGLIKKLQKKFC